MSDVNQIKEVLGEEADALLSFKAKVPKESLYLPGEDFISQVYTQTDRSTRVLQSLGVLFGHGRLGHTGYLSILPVDQGIEHTAGASFAPNPL